MDIWMLHPGGGPARRALARRLRPAARERGLRLVLADDEPGPKDGEAFDDVVKIAPDHDVAETVAILQARARARRPAAILAQTESALAAGAILAERFGLPGPGVEPALATVSKLRSRIALRAAGVPVPAFALADDAQAVRRFAAEVSGWPVVLKAVASTMGRLVTRVEGPEDVDAAVARVREGIGRSHDVARLASFAAAASLDPGCDPRRSFLVEAFVSGDPVETDGFVAAGRPRFFGVIEQVMTPPPLFYIEAYLLRPDRDPAELAEIERVSAAAAAATGLRDTGFSIELRSTGRDGDVRVIEINGRLGEDDGFPELFTAATGEDRARQALELALGGSPAILAAGAPWALAYRCCYEDAVVRRLPGAAALAAEAAASGVRLGLGCTEGERIFAPPHPLAFPHLAWALATDARSCRAALDRARAALDRLDIAIGPAG